MIAILLAHKTKMDMLGMHKFTQSYDDYAKYKTNTLQCMDNTLLKNSLYQLIPFLLFLVCKIKIDSWVCRLRTCTEIIYSTYQKINDTV